MESAATLFVDDIRKEVDQGKLVGAVFMDLSKAFDTVGHANLIEKLKCYGVNGRELSWFGDYLFNRTQVVEIEQSLSDPHPLFSGVPQGSILGPLLFLIYFNDLPDCLTNAKVIMYADDTVVYHASDKIEKIESVLNSEFKNIFDYINDSELILNLKKGKTETMLFGTAKKLSNLPHPLQIKYNSYTINTTTEYNYLGNTITPTLNFDRQFRSKCRKASGRVSLLSKVRPYLTVEAAEKVYNAMIAPIFLYCCIINLQLTATQRRSLEKIEERSSRIIFLNGEKRVPSIYSERSRRACLVVRKCTDNVVCSPMKNYFKLNEHAVRTRNQGILVRIPKIKLELGKKAFFFSGAKLHNTLSVDIRSTTNFMSFSNKLKNVHF